MSWVVVRRALDVALAVLLLVLFIAVVLVTLAIAYPAVASRAVTSFIAAYPEAAETTSRVTATADRFVGRGQDGFSYRVVRPWLAYSGQEPGRSTEDSGTDPPQQDGCTACHSDFKTKRRFAIVYFSHPIHEEAGLECDGCHVLTGPDRDRPPAMSKCMECHEETRQSEGCITCHPPGTVFHGAVSAADPATGEQCEVCHPASTLSSSARTHEMPDSLRASESCRACHKEEFCANCHPAAHPAGYASGHAADMRTRIARPSECWTCHDSRWCTLACHVSGTDSGARLQGGVAR